MRVGGRVGHSGRAGVQVGQILQQILQQILYLCLVPNLIRTRGAKPGRRRDVLYLVGGNSENSGNSASSVSGSSACGGTLETWP